MTHGALGRATTPIARDDMTTLLHVSASPQGSDSESLALADAFLGAYTKANSDVEIDHHELFDGTLPAFGPRAAAAKMAVFGGGEPSPEDTAAWDAARAVFDRFAAADAYLFSVPMWNHNVPYVLKQWIDIVTQPGWVFTFSPEAGYSGLITGRKAAAIYTSGVYAPGVPVAFGVDFHAAYFNDWLRFAGFTDVTEVRHQPTVLTPTPQDDHDAAVQQAASAGASF